MIGDLHCHTKFSDGSMSMDDVLFYAKRAGLDFVGITDHDTMAGLTRATIIGKRLGIGVVPGVEFSCFDYQRNRKVHLLCYYPLFPDRLEGICAHTNELRQKAGQEMLGKVMQFYPITAEHVQRYSAGSKAICKPHIINALMDLGYCSQVYGEVYQQLFDPVKGQCFTPIAYPDVFQVARLIRQAGGICILAHPGVYDALDVGEELAQEGLLDGLERYYPRRKQRDEDWLEQMAARYPKFIMTGGTDFHGYYTASPNPLATCITDEENLSKLFKLKRERRKGS